VAVHGAQPADGPGLPGDRGLPGDPGLPADSGQAADSGLPRNPSEAGQWFPPLAGPADSGPLDAGPDKAGASSGRDRIPIGSQAGPGSAPVAPTSSGDPASPAGPSLLPGVVVPSSAGEAMSMVLAGLGWLARADAVSLPGPTLAECLCGLERAQSVHTAARARVLGAFDTQRGYEEDGQGSPRTWLTWQTRITRAAASAALASMHRLRDHAAIRDALADGAVSASWARQICEWTDQLPAEARGDADVILLAAAVGGADLAGLAELAEEIRSRTARPDRDRDDGFADRGLSLATTLGGAGKLHADLTGRCSAALQAVLDTLGKKAGPQDTRSLLQRNHDAMEEMCRRMLASGCLPDRAGQPVQLQLQMTLDQFLNGIGTPGVPDTPAGFGVPDNPGPSQSRGPAGSMPPGPAAGPGDDCDAAVAPMVTGRVDHDLLDALAGRLTRLAGPWAESYPGRLPCHPGCAVPEPGPTDAAECDAERPREAARELSRAAARELLLQHAIALLSGPGGLASWLRTGTVPRPAASISLPLDVGTVTDLIPPHLRRAIITRDRHCAAPGCDQPPAACHVHHIIPRSRGGTTSLTNCLLLCSFHHLIMIHRWGWVIALNADGTTTATSPDGRVLHSHSPPAAA
jgi:Domain of unknown function (DUF222)/HNH endonuclease